MIPYVVWRSFQIGPVTIQVWGMFAALGVILGTWFAWRQAKRRGLDLPDFESLAFSVVVWAFIGARLFHVFFYDWPHYARSIWEIFEVWKGGLSSFGGFAGAAFAFFLGIRRSKLPLLPTADALCEALPLALGCGRIGCFLIHDHPGTLASSMRWLAVNYPGGPRYDLGMLLGIFDFLLFGVFLLLLKKKRADGFYLALFMIVYGPVRFLLDFLRVNDARYNGLTPAQYGSIGLFAVGIWLMARILLKKGKQATLADVRQEKPGGVA